MAARTLLQASRQLTLSPREPLRCHSLKRSFFRRMKAAADPQELEYPGVIKAINSA
jgi:hypothetical protein